jgi:hypothetical protein
MALDVFEEEGGATGFRGSGARPTPQRVRAGDPELNDAVGNFGDFEVGRDFFTNAAELAGFIEELDPVSEVVAGQGGSPWISNSTIERPQRVGRFASKAC